METFLTGGQQLAFAKGKILFQDGQTYRPDFLEILYVMSGEVAYVKKSASGKFLTVRLGPKHLIGLEAVYRQIYPATAMISQECLFYRWPQQQFELLVGKDIEFAVRAITSLSQHLRLTNQELSHRMTEKQGGSVQSPEALFALGREAFFNGNYKEARQYFEQAMNEDPANAHSQEIAGFLNTIEISMRMAQDESFDVTNQSQLDKDTNIQFGLYNLAFHGTEGISEDLYSKFGRYYNSGDTIFEEGDAASELYLLLKGMVQVVKNQRPVANIQEGQIFGEMAIFENKPRSATIKALNNVQVLALTKDNFKMIFQLHPTWALQLIQGFADRISNSYELLQQ